MAGVYYFWPGNRNRIIALAADILSGDAKYANYSYWSRADEIYVSNFFDSYIKKCLIGNGMGGWLRYATIIPGQAVHNKWISIGEDSLGTDSGSVSFSDLYFYIAAGHRWLYVFRNSISQAPNDIKGFVWHDVGAAQQPWNIRNPSNNLFQQVSSNSFICDENSFQIQTLIPSVEKSEYRKGFKGVIEKAFEKNALLKFQRISIFNAVVQNGWILDRQ